MGTLVERTSGGAENESFKKIVWDPSGAHHFVEVTFVARPRYYGKPVVELPNLTYALSLTRNGAFRLYEGPVNTEIPETVGMDDEIDRLGPALWLWERMSKDEQASFLKKVTPVKKPTPAKRGRPPKTEAS